jgi:hypothetical protein
MTVRLALQYVLEPEAISCRDEVASRCVMLSSRKRLKDAQDISN